DAANRTLQLHADNLAFADLGNVRNRPLRRQIGAVAAYGVDLRKAAISFVLAEESGAEGPQFDSAVFQIELFSGEEHPLRSQIEFQGPFALLALEAERLLELRLPLSLGERLVYGCLGNERFESFRQNR